MPCVGLEPKILAFERAKTVHALDRASTVIDIVVTKCAERGFHSSVTGSSNSSCRWQPPTVVSLSSVIMVLTKDAYLEEILEACSLYFFPVLDVMIRLLVCHNLVHR
jgi:hypothetical protein